MNAFQIAAIICGIVLYLAMVGSSLWLVIFADQDPECRLGGLLLSLILVGIPLAIVGWGG